MRVYTEAIHAKRVGKMLLKTNVCRKCPAAPYFDGAARISKKWSPKSDPCKICAEFVGVVPDDWQSCPCSVLGKDEAIRRTWEVLKQKGYL